MESSRFLECLAADYRRMAEVARGHLDAQVPTCPDWTVADLVRHVGTVYLHKVATMREGRNPDPWPPASLGHEAPLALLDRAYADLTAEFSQRQPADSSPTWYAPDQTVGFWIRRMAQETVIHRIDAELGAGAPVAPIPDDLALDGIDELLKMFVAYDVKTYPDDYAEALANAPARSYTISADGVEWLVGISPGTFTVGGGPGMTPATFTDADTTITAPSSALLRNLWNRETPGDDSDIIIKGAPDLTTFHRCIVLATQ